MGDWHYGEIFVSYKYCDSDVAPLGNIAEPIVRDYVDWIDQKFEQRTDDIYKGEHDDEDLSRCGIITVTRWNQFKYHTEAWINRAMELQKCAIFHK